MVLVEGSGFSNFRADLCLLANDGSEIAPSIWKEMLKEDLLDLYPSLGLVKERHVDGFHALSLLR